MSIPRYQEGETVRVSVEGVVVHHALCESPYPSELTIAVPLEGGGTYDVTVPLVDGVTIERLTPDVQPGEVWQERYGGPWFAVRVFSAHVPPSTMMLPVHLMSIRSVQDCARTPEEVHRERGPITRVYPPAPAPDTTGGQAETPDALHNALHDAIERTIEDNYADTTGGYLVAPWAVAALAARAAMAVLETRAEEADRG